MSETEFQFEVLAKTTLETAEAIDCSPSEFVSGLNRIISTLVEARTAADEYVASQNPKVEL